MFQHPLPAHVGPIRSLSFAPCGQGCTAGHALELSQPCAGAQLTGGAYLHMGCTAKMRGTLARGLHSHGACFRVRHIYMSCRARAWGTLACGPHCSRVAHAHPWDALPACGARSCVGCTAHTHSHRAHSHVRRTACAWSRLTPGVHRWHAGRCATP